MIHLLSKRNIAIILILCLLNVSLGCSPNVELTYKNSSPCYSISETKGITNDNMLVITFEDENGIITTKKGMLVKSNNEETVLCRFWDSENHYLNKETVEIRCDKIVKVTSADANIDHSDFNGNLVYGCCLGGGILGFAFLIWLVNIDLGFIDGDNSD